MARKSPWVTTKEAAEALNVSQKFLRNQRDRLFKKRQHYRLLNPRAWRPTYRWHLPNIQKLMESDSEFE